ncbi:Origin recognition complex (ORC) subunit 3 N-terminus family protein [Cryptosporidium felis]|nr:Origin recognition complex (ORC) subunit 3 N-terminus family protein [Cryptosporidium felis]
MCDKSFEILTIKPKRTKSIRSIATNELDRFDDIFTPFGTLKPITHSDKNEGSLTLKNVWDYFFGRFIQGFKAEMKDGMVKILEFINSTKNTAVSQELPLVAALSGSNSGDHVITLSILEEFLNISGVKYTIFLDHEKLGFEGLTPSRIIETIWLNIKQRFLGSIIQESSIGSTYKIINSTNNFAVAVYQEASSSSNKENTENTVNRDVKKRKSHKSCSKKNCNPNDENHLFLGEFNHSNKWLKNRSVSIDSEISNSSAYSNSVSKQKGLNAARGLKLIGSLYKTRKKNEILRPIILIIPTCETFSPGQLGQLIEMLFQMRSSYNIPFIVVLGISSNLVFVQQILGQAILKNLDYLSIQLIDSKKCFYKTIINSLIYIDDMYGLFSSSDGISNQGFRDLEVNSEFLDDSNDTFLLFPVISVKSLKLIKENFFQHNFSLLSSLRNVFLLIQIYFTNNKFEFLYQPIKMTSFDKIKENKELREKIEAKYSVKRRRMFSKNNYYDIFMKELINLKARIFSLSLAMSIINIILIDLFNFLDNNERLNIIIEWMEVIEKNNKPKLDDMIKNFAKNIINNENVLTKNIIFDKIEGLFKGLLKKNNRRLNFIYSFAEMTAWNSETLERNILGLFRVHLSENMDKMSDNLLLPFVYTSFNQGYKSTECLLEEIIKPNYGFEIVREFGKLDEPKNALIDYSIIYNIYLAIKGHKINLFKLFVLFCNAKANIIKTQESETMKGRMPLITHNEKMDSNNLPSEYKYIFDKFITIINTFQLIGLINLPQKNIFRKENTGVKESQLTKVENYFESVLGNINAHKLYWGADSLIPSDRNGLKCTREHTNDSQCELKKNDKVEDIDCKKESKNPNSTTKDSTKHVSKNRLEAVRMRAAELNQKIIQKFKEKKLSKRFNSAIRLKELRYSKKCEL